MDTWSRIHGGCTGSVGSCPRPTWATALRTGESVPTDSGDWPVPLQAQLRRQRSAHPTWGAGSRWLKVLSPGPFPRH
eukprot:8131500-Alexandrium_andersonii.AAC.1